MHRTWVGRTFAVLFAFWFAFSLAEPSALHSCPMHGAGATDAHAHGTVSHHAGATRHSSSDPEHGTRHCTCLGACCASSANAALPAVGIAVETVAAYEIERHTPALRARAVTVPPFFLPYANGPPAPVSLA